MPLDFYSLYTYTEIMNITRIFIIMIIVATSMRSQNILAMEASATDEDNDVQTILNGINAIELHRLSAEEQFARRLSQALSTITAKQQEKTAESGSTVFAGAAGAAQSSPQGETRKKIRIIRRDRASFTSIADEQDDQIVGKKRILSDDFFLRQVKQHPSSPVSPRSPAGNEEDGILEK